MEKEILQVKDKPLHWQLKPKITNNMDAGQRGDLNSARFVLAVLLTNAAVVGNFLTNGPDGQLLYADYKSALSIVRHALR